MTYRTSVSDPFLRLLAFLAISFVGMITVLAMVDLYSLWLVITIYLLVMVGLSYFVMKLFSCSVVETELLPDRLRLRWIQQTPLARQKDGDILFDQVKEDGFMTSSIQQVYTLFMKDGSEFTYTQFALYMPRHQDLEAMARDIRERIEYYHENNPEPWRPAGYEKDKDKPLTQEQQRNLSARTYISFFAVVGIYLMVGFPVLKMLLPERPLLWDLKVLAIVTSVLMLLAKVLGSYYERMQNQGAGNEEASE